MVGASLQLPSCEIRSRLNVSEKKVEESHSTSSQTTEVGIMEASITGEVLDRFSTVIGCVHAGFLAPSVLLAPMNQVGPRKPSCASLNDSNRKMPCTKVHPTAVP